MKQLKLSVSKREERGRNVARRLRASGQVPAVIYGRSGSRALTLNEPEFRKLMRSSAGAAMLIDVIDDTGASTLSVIQDVQRHPYKDTFMHVDFHEVSADEEMHTSLPVHVEGESVGVKNESGVLEVPVHSIEVKCLPKDLPEFIEVDVTELHIGQSIHLGDLKLISGVTFLGDAGLVIVACSEPAKIVEAAPAAEEEAEGEEKASEGEEKSGEGEKSEKSE